MQSPDTVLGFNSADSGRAESFFAIAAAFLDGFFFLDEHLVALSGDRGVTTGRSCCCLGFGGCGASVQETVGN